MVARLARVEDDPVKPWAALIDAAERFGGKQRHFVVRVGEPDIVDRALTLKDVSKGTKPNDEYFAARGRGSQFVSLRFDGLYSLDRAAMWSNETGFVYFFRLILVQKMMIVQRFFHARF